MTQETKNRPSGAELDKYLVLGTLNVPVEFIRGINVAKQRFLTKARQTKLPPHGSCNGGIPQNVQEDNIELYLDAVEDKIVVGFSVIGNCPQKANCPNRTYLWYFDGNKWFQETRDLSRLNRMPGTGRLPITTTPKTSA